MFNKNLIYFVKYSLNMHDYQGLILGVLGATAFISIPFWSFLALKIGKKNAWLFSMGILFAGLIVFYLYPISNISELLVILGFIGLGNGATGILFWSMLPDTIEYGEWKTGIRTESSLYGFMTFAQKVAIAIAALALGWALTVIEFVPNTIQSVETLMNLKLIMVWVPIVGILISFALICFYPIDSNYHKQLIKEINERN
jgi:GPH family glycoside/pentoside/hexuronide:cation symporter